MNILLAYSSVLLGEDPVVGALAAELHTLLDANVTVINTSAPYSLAVDFDMVITLNTADWYLKNRLKLPGRFLSFICCFCLEDFFSILRANVPMHDLGLNSIFVNCKECVRQVSAAIPLKFMLKPVVSSVFVDRTCRFGAVAHNIKDRDFSQFALTAELLKPYGVAPTLFISKNETMRLPEAVIPFAQMVEPSLLFTKYTSIVNHIATPRMTDYRSGIIPVELLQAIASGCKPMMIHHPIFDQLSKVVPMYRSITAYTASVEELANGGELQGAAPEALEQFTLTPARYAEELSLVYRRLKANAPT